MALPEAHEGVASPLHERLKGSPSIPVLSLVYKNGLLERHCSREPRSGSLWSDQLIADNDSRPFMRAKAHERSQVLHTSSREEQSLAIAELCVGPSESLGSVF